MAATANNRHGCDTGSAGSLRSTSARRSPGSFAELSCQKIVFHLQLANLPVQKIDLCLVGHTVDRCATAFENARRPV